MTKDSFQAVLELTGLPVVYSHFRKATELPYIVFELNADTQTFADNTHLQEIAGGFVELYTAFKDTAAEKLVRDVLLEAGIAFGKDYESYDRESDTFVNRWRFQFLYKD